MTLSNRNDLSIVELIVYAPACLFGIFLCVRHGFGPNKGWIFLVTFSLVRISGASLELATISFPTSIPLQTSAALLSSVGLSPLLLITFGLLFRVCKSINKEYHTLIQTKHIRLMRLPIIAALVLVIIGSDNSASDLVHHGIYPIQVMTKVGIILLVAVFAFVVLVTAMFMFRSAHAEPGERRLIKAIAASVPSILIRLIYVVLITFSHIQMFSVLYGSVVGLGCMAIMQEMIVIIIYIGVGITLPRKIKEPRVQAESRWTRDRTIPEGRVGRSTAFLGRPASGHERVVSEQVVLNNFCDGKL